MKKKGQAGPIGGIILFLFFIIIWFVWLGGWVNEVGDTMVTTNDLTGIVAFFYSNINLIIMIGLVLGMMSFVSLALIYGGT